MLTSKDTKAEEIVRYTLLVLTVLGVVFSIRYSFQNIENPYINNIVILLPFILFLTPFLILSLYKVKKVNAKMEVVPRFLRDIVDNFESGMDLISSIKATGQNEYSVLNEDIHKFVNQLSWGVDFEEALINFSNNVGSHELKRDFQLIIEARRVGGHVDKILRELSTKISVDILRGKERKSNLASNTFTGYISFIIFAIIIVVVYNNLFLDLGTALGSGGGGGGTTAVDADGNPIETGGGSSGEMAIYLTLLMLLSYELAILSGFLFGLMQENNIIAGAPHVVVLVLITFLVFFFFINWEISIQSNLFKLYRMSK
jgi:archaellum biogenesis protein FlaJ (TadC family)